jgi:mannose-6-phosphate isomerase-like protein (cupin superfamily)
MDVHAYISSGIIEDYCLGILSEEENNAVLKEAQTYPEIKQVIDDCMYALDQYALDASMQPPANKKQQIMQLLDNLKIEEEKNIQQLPLLNRYTDHKNWLHIVEPVLPDGLQEPMFVHELRRDETISQILIWTHVDYPDEVHENVRECFIILRGKCRCFIGEEVVELGPGGFLEIPMYTHHNVEVLGNDPVLAVIQRVKVA